MNLVVRVRVRARESGGARRRRPKERWGIVSGPPSSSGGGGRSRVRSVGRYSLAAARAAPTAAAHLAPAAAPLMAGRSRSASSTARAPPRCSPPRARKEGVCLVRCGRIALRCVFAKDLNAGQHQLISLRNTRAADDTLCTKCVTHMGNFHDVVMTNEPRTLWVPKVPCLWRVHQADAVFEAFCACSKCRRHAACSISLTI